MSKVRLLEKYYTLWRTEQHDLKIFLMNLESRMQEIDERLLRLESGLLALREEIKNNNAASDVEKIWIQIRGYAIENGSSLLLNPSRSYKFVAAVPGHVFHFSLGYLPFSPSDYPKLSRASSPLRHGRVSCARQL